MLSKTKKSYTYSINRLPNQDFLSTWIFFKSNYLILERYPCEHLEMKRMNFLNWCSFVWALVCRPHVKKMGKKTINKISMSITAFQVIYISVILILFVNEAHRNNANHYCIQCENFLPVARYQAWMSLITGTHQNK